MGGTGADLVYNGDDISAYTGLNLKTNLNSSDGKEILALMQALEDGEGLEKVLDVEKALSDLKKDQVLQQYQFFVGDDAFASTEKLKQVREEENFWL